ncbi:MAG: hypothetical protein AAF399_15980 [Bacteroidota bacterium]
MKGLLSLFSLLLITLPLSAEQVLGELDFSRGSWAMIGVPVHNYHMMPVQQDLGTFIVHDLQMMQDIQQAWDLEMTFEDNCDYHYSLKFYQDQQLVQTVSVNLYCGYLTINGLSYAFDVREFDRFQQGVTEVPWSRISFGELDLLKEAITTLDKAQEVYWYEDVYQYRYSGFCMVSVNGLPWSSSLDSLQMEVDRKVVDVVGSQDFYLQTYYHMISNDKLSVRYIINCEPWLADRLDGRTTMAWRNHFHNRDSIRVLAIGLDEQRYRKLMNQ